MKKLVIILIPIIIILIHNENALAQQDVYVVDTTLNNTHTVSEKYHVHGQMKLESGFSFSAATSGTLHIKSVSPLANEVPQVQLDQFKVVTENILIEGIKEDRDIYNLSNIEKAISVEYRDGMDRTSLVFDVGSSPSEKSIIASTAYDEFGKPTNYLPYTATSNGTAFYSSHETDQKNFYKAEFDKVVNDSKPYVFNIYEDSPLGRVKKSGAPGEYWQADGSNSTTHHYLLNDANEVRKFNYDGTSSAFYNASKLGKYKVTDAEGIEVLLYKDSEGKVILKKESVKDEIEGVYTEYLETYYVYNDVGLLMFVIQPKGVALMQANGWTFSSTIKQQYTFEYIYDAEGRLVEKKVPGAGWVYIIYDNLNRPVLTQDEKLRSENKWYYVKVDRMNRPVYSGLYQDVTNTSRIAMQDYVNTIDYGPNDHYEVRKASTDHGYSNRVFPTVNYEVHLVNYYDDYDFDFNGDPDYSYASQNLGSEEPASLAKIRGMQTGSKRLILNSTSWLIDVNFYDKNRRLVQTQSNNQLNTVVEDATTIVYNAHTSTGVKLNSHAQLITKKIQKHKSSSTDVITVSNSYEYDHRGRLLHSYQDINGTGKKLINSLEYNELGQVVENDLIGLGANTGDGYLQSVDYRYNIRGWLTSINNSELKDNQYTGNFTNNDADDIFGMEILYEKNDAELGNTGKNNGFISAVKWQTYDPFNLNNTERQRGYIFDYDKRGQLRNASFKGKGATDWTVETGAYNIENLSYDHNGNILSVDRYGLFTEGGTRSKVDGLTFAYSGNQLIQTNDSGNQNIGFIDGAALATEYLYDANGNMITDHNKSLTMTYNYLNKIETVNHSSGSITYKYDGAGVRVSRLIDDGTTQTIQQYVKGFIYENGQLSFFNTPNGVVKKTATGDFEHNYYITDNQGNVRVVFKDRFERFVYRATMESDITITDEQQYFSFPVSPVPYELANITPDTVNYEGKTEVISGNEVIRLNSANRLGTSIALPVKPGDLLDISVYAFYEDPDASNTITDINPLISATAGVFGGVSGGSEQEQFIFDAVKTALGEFPFAPENEADVPNAYLNYIFFDNDFKFVEGKAVEVTSASLNTPSKIGTPSPISVKKAGYVYVYLSYSGESEYWVSFDELVVDHTSHIPEVLAQNTYYPFGMRMEGVVNNTPLNTDPNQHLYNAGSEFQNDLLNQMPGYLSTFFREYDPAIMRFTGVDVMAEKYHSLNSYHYGNNNPVMYNDPTGAEYLSVEDMVNDAWNATPEGWNLSIHYDNGAATGYFGYNPTTGRTVYGGSNWMAAAGSLAEAIPSASFAYKNGTYTFSYFKLKLAGTPYYAESTDKWAGGQFGDFNEIKINTDIFGAFKTGTYLAGTSTTLNELFWGYEYYKGYKSDSRKALSRASPGRFKGLSNSTLNKLANFRVAKAVAKGLGRSLLGAGIVLSAVDVYQNDFSGSSVSWAVADTGIAIAAIAASGPAAPVVAVGAIVYFTARFGYGIYEAYNEGN